MGKSKSANVSTLRTPPRRTGGEQTFLLILLDGQFVTRPLPSIGEVIVGRSDECDLTIAHPSISRRHIRLRLGEKIQIEDLGSSNGTTVQGQPLMPKQSHTIATNESFALGDVTVVVQRRAALARARRLWNHDYFEGRLQEECALAERRGSTFTLMSLSVENRGLDPDNFYAPLGDVLREVDVVGVYGPGQLEIILVDTEDEEADLIKWRLKTSFKSQGFDVAISRAQFGKDGRDADKLLAKALNLEPSFSGAAEGIVVQDPSMKNLHDLAARVAVGSINVLVLGETGVGKQVVAETIHRRSKRVDKPFLQLNCSALSEHLLESELFGHEKGAFTGAVQTKEGLLETANGGSVFLDEIGDMALPLQAKLLRVIENQEVLRVGGLKPRTIDVRFIAATNRDLEADVALGKFRQDLLFRINGVTLEVPPLRERKVELIHLAHAFLDAQAKKNGTRKLEMSPAAVELLEGYRWPGNIRELRNVIERAMLLAGDEEIQPSHLPVEKMTATYTASFAAVAPPPDVVPRVTPGKGAPRLAFGETHEEKKQRVLDVLAECGGNNTEAAKALGVSRRTLGKWLVAYGIPRPRKARKLKA